MVRFHGNMALLQASSCVWLKQMGVQSFQSIICSVELALGPPPPPPPPRASRTAVTVNEASSQASDDRSAEMEMSKGSVATEMRARLALSLVVGPLMPPLPGQGGAG